MNPHQDSTPAEYQQNEDREGNMAHAFPLVRQ